MFDKIAVVGKMHAGKTTLANALQTLDYTRIAFADPVKEASAMMLSQFSTYMGTPKEYTIADMNAMKGHPSIRALLQLVGTELGRKWHGPESVWIDLFEAMVEDTEGKIVNDDCRFVNEAERLKQMGFTVVKLERPGDQRIESIVAALKKDNPTASSQDISVMLEKILSHPSETEVDSIVPDYVFASPSVKALQRLARVLASGDTPSILRSLDFSDLYKEGPDQAVDLIIGMRAAYAH